MVAVFGGVVRKARLEAVARTRLCGRRKSRTGCDVRVGASCTKSFAAEMGDAQAILRKLLLCLVPPCVCCIEVFIVVEKSLGVANAD